MKNGQYLISNTIHIFYNRKHQILKINELKIYQITLQMKWINLKVMFFYLISFFNFWHSKSNCIIFFVNYHFSNIELMRLKLWKDVKCNIIKLFMEINSKSAFFPLNPLLLESKHRESSDLHEKHTQTI